MRVKTSFGTRLTWIIACCVFVPFLITGILAYHLYYNLIDNELRETISKQMGLAAQYIDNYVSGVDRNIMAYFTESEIYNSFSRPYTTAATTITINNRLNQLCYSGQGYLNAYMTVLEQQAVYRAYDDPGSSEGYEQLLENAWFQQAENEYGYTVTSYHQGGAPYLFYIRAVRNFQTAAYQGAITVKIQPSVLRGGLELLDAHQGDIYCFTSSGTPVFQLSEQEPSQDGTEIFDLWDGADSHTFIRQGNRYVFFRACQNADLVVAYDMPRTVVRNTASAPFGVGLLLFFAFLMAGVVTSAILVRRLVAPINSLANTMQRANLNDLQYVTLSKRTDEVAVLEGSYNKMVSDFNALLEQEYKATIQRRNAQLKALQFQINPHFVNNTLQMIGALAVDNGVPEIYHLLRIFSIMFYYCIKYKGDIVTVQEELDYLRNYLILQDRRFPGKYEVRYAVDGQVTGCQIPKMVLQPLVENCFQHAFAGAGDGWRIDIAAVGFADQCEIMVQDNGHGIEPERLADIRVKLRMALDRDVYDYSGSIGLQNVHSRLQLLYGGDYGLHIESIPAEGTSIILRIPYTEEAPEKGGNGSGTECP